MHLQPYPHVVRVNPFPVLCIKKYLLVHFLVNRADAVVAGNTPAAPTDTTPPVKIERKRTLTLVQYIDYMWAWFGSVMNMPLVGDANYVPLDLPMSKAEVMKTTAALFLRVSRDAAKAAKLYQADPEGQAKYAELVTPAMNAAAAVAAKFKAATSAVKATPTPASKEALAKATVENLKAQKDLMLANAKFKNAAIMNFSYERIPGNGPEVLIDLPMKTFTNMMRRVPAFQALIDTLNPYVNRPPINLDLNAIMAKMSGDAAAAQADADAAMMADLSSADLGGDLGSDFGGGDMGGGDAAPVDAPSSDSVPADDASSAPISDAAPADTPSSDSAPADEQPVDAWG